MLVSLYLLQARGASFEQVKWLRLVLPYLFWSIIYLCLRSLKSVLQGDGGSFEDWTLKALLTGGAAVHLYFIPLLIVYQLIACALTGLFSKDASKSTVILSCGTLVILFLLSSIMELESTVIGSESGLFVDAILAVICAQGLVSLRTNASPVQSNLYKWMLAFFTLALLWWQTNTDDQILVKIMISSGILYLILQMPVLNRLRRLNRLFTASFGIFLMHHFIIELAEVILTQLGINLFPYDFNERILGTFAVIVICYGLIYLIRYSKFLSLLLIGEKKA